LLEDAILDENSNDLFEILNHFNSSLDLITNPKEN